MTKTGVGRYNVKITWMSPNPGGQGVDYFTVKVKDEAKNESALVGVSYFEDVPLGDEQYYASVQAFSRLGWSQEIIVSQWYKSVILADGDHRHVLQWLAVAFTAFAFCTAALAVGYKYVYWPKAAAAAGDAGGYDLAMFKDLRDNGDLFLDYKDVTVSDVILGHGHFGVVRKGSVRADDGGECPVAVKSLQDHPTSRDIEEFLGEIVLMQKVGQHTNIVSMVGCCLDANKQCLLVVEYCPLGDLQTYLRKVRLDDDLGARKIIRGINVVAMTIFVRHTIFQPYFIIVLRDC